MPGWVVEATADYVKRMPRDCRVEIVEVPVAQRGRDTERAKRDEGDRLLAAIGPRDRVICLEVNGKRWSTPDLAEQLGNWQQEGRDVALLIGGPDGLSPACRDRCDLKWSLSPLTLPHVLARVVVVEQLYRAWSVLAGHPYHRE